jgi:hypothetical protein
VQLLSIVAYIAIGRDFDIVLHHGMTARNNLEAAKLYREKVVRRSDIGHFNHAHSMAVITKTMREDLSN